MYGPYPSELPWHSMYHFTRKAEIRLNKGVLRKTTRPDVEVDQNVLTEWKRNLKSRGKAGEGHLGERKSADSDVRIRRTNVKHQHNCRL
jgi:hypothetical protein